MATVYRCDRCGKHYAYKENHRVTLSGGTGDTYYYNEYDLCKECRDALGDFMNGVPVPTLMEKLKAALKKED